MSDSGSKVYHRWSTLTNLSQESYMLTSLSTLIIRSTLSRENKIYGKSVRSRSNGINSYFKTSSLTDIRGKGFRPEVVSDFSSKTIFSQRFTLNALDSGTLPILREGPHLLHKNIVVPTHFHTLILRKNIVQNRTQIGLIPSWLTIFPSHTTRVNVLSNVHQETKCLKQH